MIVEGTITRDITPEGGSTREVVIPFFIDTETGNYSQWEHDTYVLGENVGVLEAMRDALMDVDE